MNKLYVIGAGPGSADMLTPEARSAINASDLVWCAERNDALVPETKRRPLTPFGTAMDEMAQALERGENAAALLSGDTGLYSLLPLLVKHFGKENVHVICGISSMQALCARLGINWQDAKIVSAHGRALSKNALCHFCRTNPKTIVLLDGENNPKWVRDTLYEGGLGELKLYIGEKLSYPDEYAGPYEDRAYDSLSAAAILNDAPQADVRQSGLNDDSFIRGKTPMTKSEIRAQVISKLGLAPDSVVWDVGAGTGSVSVECALKCPLGEVYAVERDADALELIGQNRDKFHALNINIIPGSAPEALEGLSAPTHVFLGGTGGETEEILKKLEGFGRRIRVCATAVTMESAQLYMKLLSGYADLSAAQIAVSRLEKVGRYNMFKAQNPVFVFAATMEGKV
ncbi:MAG: precorrin-6y C5,15-methyltransferase (decarboxylating) subunit CbiE [Clostridiales bacterium]|nr:precorrin-6y C5,15-methyltransferase (decarboxylating) subunit CbiE [Clostridiales bacterium]